MEEKWLEGYEGLYKVNTLGEVKRYYVNGKIRRVGSQSGGGHIYVNLSKDGVKSSKLVHRLIAATFIPNPEGYLVVDHIDEDKTNNKIENLRWCTQQQNTAYYNTKDGRDYHARLRREGLEKVRKLKQEIIGEKREVKRLEKEVQALHSKLDQEKLKFEEYITMMNEKILASGQVYQGYKDTTNVKFGSVKAMVEATGKEIYINGVLYPSCGAAAGWITQQEAIRGVVRNKDTISKELRKYLQGRRVKWIMYDRYAVGE